MIAHFEMNTSFRKFLRRLFLAVIISAIYIYFSVDKPDDPNQLRNILERRLSDGENIFFVETSGAVNASELASLNSRQACSVESAALTNPNASIFMIFSEKLELNQTKIIQALKEYKNIFFLRLELEEFSKDTITEPWITSGLIFNTKFLRENFSNVIRLLLLWRFDK